MSSPSNDVTPPGQVLMPWGEAERVTLGWWASTGGLRVELELWQEGHALGVDLALLDVGLGAAGPARAAVRLELGAAPRCVLNDQPATWNLTDEVRERSEVFMALDEWLCQCVRDLPLKPSSGMVEPLRLIREASRAMAARAIALCQPVTRAAALGFPDAERLAVYAACAGDATGRMRELAAVCPAAVALVCWIDAELGATWAEPIRAAIAAGERLPRVLDLELEAWSRWGRRLWRDASWTRADDRGAAMRTTQRARWRRAPLGIPIEILIASPVEGAALSDLARQGSPRAWYEALAALDVHDRVGCLLPAVRRRLAGFVSAHASVLVDVAWAGPMGLEGLLGDLLDWVVATGGPGPCRQSAVDRTLRALEAWREGVGDGDVGFPDETALAEPPARRADHDGLVLEAITSVAGLRAESREMRHCVVTFAGHGVGGTRAFFRATLGDERLTVALQREGARWALSEVAGPDNRRASADATARLRSWAASLGGDQAADSASTDSRGV